MYKWRLQSEVLETSKISNLIRSQWQILQIRIFCGFAFVMHKYLFLLVNLSVYCLHKDSHSICELKAFLVDSTQIKFTSCGAEKSWKVNTLNEILWLRTANARGVRFLGLRESTMRSASQNHLRSHSFSIVHLESKYLQELRRDDIFLFMHRAFHLT